MKIEWVNHASFILEIGDIRLISDPWMEGTVFDNGWALLSKTQFTYEDFENITHIWFSHEHPDHFFPPNIKKIPPEFRKEMTILFQKTEDKKVVKFCRDLGFSRVIELNHDEIHQLNDDVHIMCSPFGDDSWISFKTRDMTILNTNDCEFSTREQLEKVVQQVGSVDLLLTQFSYAGYPGNKAAAIEKLEKLKLQAEVFQPKYLIPFASYVWFCHEENDYMNRDSNKIGDVFNIIKNETNSEPVVLYPGDVWDITQQHDSSISILKYEIDYKKKEDHPELIKTKTIEIVDLNNSFSSFMKSFKANNNLALLKFFKLKQPTIIYILDYKKAYKLSVIQGTFEEVNVEYDYCDVALSSEALNFCFKFPWGWDTLNINGRFQIPKHGNVQHFRKIGGIQLANSHGRNYKIKEILRRRLQQK